MPLLVHYTFLKVTKTIHFFLFIEFIAVKLVNKIIYLSGAQFHNTSSVYCLVCSPPKSSLHPSTFILPEPLPPPSISLPLAITTLLSASMSFIFFFAQSLHPPVSLPSCNSAPYLWVCHYFACYFIFLLHSTYE